ncbi:5263_t:CDS:2 [Entrophospora sp. SA101]|nr:2794_t:CDS:2 [Entrophospora sp. SA101]CAJ0867170.1 5263_t:CDS:2 [Entrophospora sp. SA101]
MEQPSVTSSATRSVDYLGQSHQWSDTDVLYSYKEISSQLNACARKCRDEKEKERNISKQLQRRKELSALKADEKRLVRMKNALWRRMGPTLGVVAKGNKLVSPRTLKWQKECDILWLFGPLYQPDSDPFMDDDDDETLVGSPPATCFLKKPVEHDPLKDLISYACELMLLNNKNDKTAIDNKFYEKIFNNRNYGHGSKAYYYNSNDKLSSPPEYYHQQEQQKPKKKKSIRFSRNLEQVHYTPTHYSIRPPPARLNANGNDYHQIFARAKEQVKSTGKLQLFVLSSSPTATTTTTKNQPKPVATAQQKKSVSTNSSKSRNNKNATVQQINNRKLNKHHRGVTTNHVVEHSETLDDSGVVKRCVDVASNVKDVWKATLQDELEIIEAGHCQGGDS